MNQIDRFGYLKWRSLVESEERGVKLTRLTAKMEIVVSFTCNTTERCK